MSDLTFQQVRDINVKRSNEWHSGGLNSWSYSDWFTALSGEVGELGNVIKKLNRVRDNLPGNKQTPEQLSAEIPKEIADIFLYLDLICARFGYKLDDCVKRKFNEVSERNGFSQKL